jgi:hypothetical protein
MFATADIACDASISLGPDLGSDHLPVIITTRLSPKDPLILPPKWLINDDHWHDWNATISANLNNKGFADLDNPQEANDLFYYSLIETSDSLFKMTKPTHRITQEKINHSGPNSATRMSKKHEEPSQNRDPPPSLKKKC